jgi:hypothetical protein
MANVSIHEMPPAMVKLTDKDCGVMYVNRNHIEIIHRIELHPENVYTKITLAGNIVLHVNETPETILVNIGEMR